MKNFKSSFKYHILIAGIIFFYSCKKNTEEKIVGTWSRVNYTLPEKWQFDSDGKLQIFLGTNGVIDSVPKSTMKYLVDSRKKIIIDSIEPSTYFSFYGTWEIDKLKDDMLIMFYENGGLEQREFVKE